MTDYEGHFSEPPAKGKPIFMLQCQAKGHCRAFWERDKFFIFDCNTKIVILFPDGLNSGRFWFNLGQVSTVVGRFQ